MGAIACLEAGSFVSCGLITQACVAGSTDNFWAGLLLTLIYWSIAQVLFILFVYAYRALTAFDDLEQFHANNVAGGLIQRVHLRGPPHRLHLHDPPPHPPHLH